MMNTQEEQAVAKQADNIIRNSVMFSVGAGLIPVPVADMMAVTAVQIEMIRRLCKLYQVDFKETEGKAAVLALTTSGVAKLGGRMLAKMIPFVGSVIGGVAVSAFSGAATYAVGEVFKRHFSNGGTFLNFDWASFKNYYNEKFEKGKAYSEQIKEEYSSQQISEYRESTNEMLEALQKLHNMKASGAINEADYEILKADIMKKIV
ncbi:MAG: DUF697 domain-containing protein [Saprospiraceae bacterium]|jgi:uncharacterized protein (DUF697 family)|nr:DUF697 domain-containing protein [Saprospiraceae bacterium]HQU94505.1 DUF697 domain-containing protein [Saprospiraceae bacterium]HQW94289.1 DUF697 domain-containing protein [Saprospiraceae bacterium]